MKKSYTMLLLLSIFFFIPLFPASVLAAPNYKLDIVFVPSVYTDLTIFQADAARLQNYLLSLEPFRSRSQDLQFHTLNKIFDLNCQNMIDPQNPLKVLDICKNPSTIKNELSAAGISFDKIIILSNGLLIGGAHADRSGDFALVSARTTTSEKTFAHEFGHLLGLFDEYETNRNSGLDLERAKGKSSVANCSTVSTCSDWKNIAGTQCLPGCDRTEWFRSSDNSFMKDTSTASSFNLVSQQLLSKRIDEYVKDMAPPIVSILSPEGGGVFRGGIGTPDKGIVDSLFEIKVSAQDESFISRIELMVDQQIIETKALGRDVLEALPAPYYTFFWNSGQSAFGSKHTVSATAYDSAGNIATSKTNHFTIESQLEYLRGYREELLPEKTPEKKVEEKIPEFKNPEFPPPPKLSEEQLKKFEEDAKKMMTPPPPPPGIESKEIPPPKTKDLPFPLIDRSRVPPGVSDEFLKKLQRREIQKYRRQERLQKQKKIREQKKKKK